MRSSGNDIVVTQKCKQNLKIKLLDFLADKAVSKIKIYSSLIFLTQSSESLSNSLRRNSSKCNTRGLSNLVHLIDTLRVCTNRPC